MQKMRFSVEIRSPKETVWETLWTDKTFRDWASNIDEGIYMTGELKEGNEVQFLSPGGGVTSVVDTLILNEFVSFRHMTDAQDGGERARNGLAKRRATHLRKTTALPF